MSSGIVLAGLAMAAVGFTGKLGMGERNFICGGVPFVCLVFVIVLFVKGRLLMRSGKPLLEKLRLPSTEIFNANSKYYKGGFDPKMTVREASLILGIRFILP